MPMQLLNSPAKVNLILDILFKRSDGFHEVDFVMQELELHDTIIIHPRGEPASIRIQCSDSSIPTDEKNLAFKAVQVMQEVFVQKNPGKKAPGIEIVLDKKIPSAGGLGGGSSNAGTVLKALNAAWALNLSKQALAEKAAVLGSDAPFFIYGGTCRAQGRGEKITPIEPCPALFLAFVVPPIHVPADKTKWIYSHFRVENVSMHPSVERMRAAIHSHSMESVAREMGNAFEFLKLPEYLPVFQEIEKIKRVPGVLNAILAGAGPTICAVCESQIIAQKLVHSYTEKSWKAFATRTA
ncbi:MAG: 4-(cytidine 5'-diphospho)-2-C-methyl-D-erythritol kinase [Candidatus Diapherotrites archaeon]|nr:4-(cytidine 5'-diphospho)-2-C-methyl-D-erythritol kinase [Candidatus Diapherotrites archaeon]